MTEMTKRVALFCAIEIECRPLVRKLGLRRTTVGQMEVFRGSIGSVDTLVVMTEMGRHNARDSASRLFDTLPVDHAMMVGIAGGLGTSKKHDVVSPVSVLDKHSGEEFNTSPLSGARRAGRLLTQDHIGLTTAELEDFVQGDFLALDMETSAVAEVCSATSITFEVFRGISDYVSETPAEVQRLARPDGTPEMRAVLKHVLRNPISLHSLVRLGWNAKKAADSAASAAAQALRTIR